MGPGWQREGRDAGAGVRTSGADRWGRAVGAGDASWAGRARLRWLESGAGGSVAEGGRRRASGGLGRWQVGQGECVSAGLGPRRMRERGTGLREWAVPGIAGLSAWRDAGWSWAERAGPGERERRRRAGPLGVWLGWDDLGC